MPTSPVLPTLAYTVSDLAGPGRPFTSRNTFYRAVADGDIEARKVRGRTIVLATELERFLCDLPKLPAKRKASV
jgi:hypothetical protein